MSKKKKKNPMKYARKTWTVNPVTRKKEDNPKYNRSKENYHAENVDDAENDNHDEWGYIDED